MAPLRCGPGLVLGETKLGRQTCSLYVRNVRRICHLGFSTPVTGVFKVHQSITAEIMGIVPVGKLVDETWTLNRQSQQLLSALSSACDFKSHICKQCGSKSDCSFRSSLIWVHTVCKGAVWSGSTLFARMQKIASRSLQEYSADDINRHFQMQFFLAL